MNTKTAARLAELRRVPFADLLQAAVDLLRDDASAWGRFHRNKPDGWVVMIGNDPLPHRPLIARAIRIASGAERASPDFEGGGTEYKPVFEDFGLTIRELN